MHMCVCVVTFLLWPPVPPPWYLADATTEESEVASAEVDLSELLRATGAQAIELKEPNSAEVLASVDVSLQVPNNNIICYIYIYTYICMYVYICVLSELLRATGAQPIELKEGQPDIYIYMYIYTCVCIYIERPLNSNWSTGDRA